MIDVHSHILPGLDDGAGDQAESFKLLRTACKEGVDCIFATPHCCDGTFDSQKKEILEKCANLNAALPEAGIDIAVLPGAEVRVNPDLVQMYDGGELLTLNNSGAWLLIELPPMFIAKGVFLILRQLKERGVTPVIAHPERNPAVLADSDLAGALIRHGGCLQVTAGSILGDYGPGPMKAAKKILQEGQVFCIGSDIHPGRKYRMKAAEKRIAKTAGRIKADKIVSGNPSGLLETCTNIRKKKFENILTNKGKNLYF